MKLFILAIVLWVALTYSAVDVVGSIIINGDFSHSEDLFGYIPTGNIVSEPTGEFAQLETDGDLPRTLEQTFILPTTNMLFYFDFAFSTEGTGFVAGFPDSFAVSIITSIDKDFLDIFVVDLYRALPDPSHGRESLAYAKPIGVSYNTGYTIDGFTPFAGGTTITGRQLPPFRGPGSCLNQFHSMGRWL